MATLEQKDYVRKIRQGKEEIIISLSKNFLKEKNLKVGDKLNLLNLNRIK